MGKKKRMIMIVIMILACCFLFSAVVGAEGAKEEEKAEPTSKYGGRIIYGVSAAPPTLDWHFTTANATRYVSKYIWEGLVEFDGNNDIQPMLCERYEVSSDKLTWTFYLRKGVKFHNGKEMTAEDVVASAKRWAEISPRRGPLGPVKSIEAADDYTVQFKLDSPLGALPAVMSLRSGHLVIMPKEVCEGVAGGKLTEYIGTGPYEFVEWKQDSHILLKRFEDYSQVDSEPSGYAGRKEAYADEIMVRFVPETSTLIAGLETGEFDVVEPILPLDVPRLEANAEINLHRYPKWSLTTYFNTKRPPFDDVRLRQAVNDVLDMEEIMLSVGKKPNNIELMPYKFREDSVWYSDVWKPYYNLQDVEGAKKLMREAGYNGEELVFMTTKDYPWMYDMALPLTDQLTDIGFNIKLEVIDWPTVVSRRSQVDEWDMFTTGGGPAVDPIMASQNYMGDYPGWYTSEEVQKQLEIIAREDDFDVRYEATEKMYKKIFEDVPHVNPGWLFEFRGFREDVKGLPHWVECVLWNVYKE